MIYQIRIKPALGTEPTVRDALHDGFIADIQLNDGVTVVVFQIELSLFGVAGKAVEKKAIIPIVDAQSVADNLLNCGVGDELPR
jgi:hypothetical protein